MDLVRDVEDKLVLDRDGREIGRVDRVLLEMRDDGPRVVALEIGPAVLASRLSPLLGRWMAGLERALGIDQGRPLRIPTSDIISLEPHIRVNRMFAETPASVVEASLRRWLPKPRGTS